MNGSARSLPERLFAGVPYERLDLHNHTIFSDGSKTPEEVVERAKGLGLSRIAITDHDGVGGVERGLLAGKELGVDVLAGIEFSAESGEGIGLHILGYDLDFRDKELNDICEEIRAKRQRRNDKLLAALEEDGYPVTMDEIVTRPGQDFTGKPNIARALVRKGYIENKDEAFTKIFSREKYRAIKKAKIGSGESVELIVRKGGIPVLAHPGLIRHIGERGSEEFAANLEKILDDLTAHGLVGIECYYPKHSAAEIEMFKEIAGKRGLIITKGSDYHGD